MRRTYVGVGLHTSGRDRLSVSRTFRPKAGDWTRLWRRDTQRETFQICCSAFNGTQPASDKPRTFRIGGSRATSFDTIGGAFGPRGFGPPDIGAEIEQPFMHDFFLEALVKQLGELVVDRMGVPFGCETWR